MRLIGILQDKKQAKRFSKYLRSQELPNQLTPQAEGFEIWIINDDDVDTAKAAFETFQQNPEGSQFRNIRIDKTSDQRNERQIKRNRNQYFQRAHGNSVTISLVVICVMIYILTLTSIKMQVFSALMILPLSQPWRLITPIFLHFSIIHILFNMFWLYDLGSLIEKKEKRVFYILLLVTSAVFANFMQLWFVNPYFGGMSGVVYALFAYLWISAKFNPWSGYYISNGIVVWMLGWLVLCFTGYIGNVANFGHLGGLIAGAVWAFAKRFYDMHHKQSG